MLAYSLDDMFAMAWGSARSSSDPSTQNGAVIVMTSGLLLTGDNNFTRGIKPSPENLVRPLKYALIEHAERNTIYAAARCGSSPSRATMVCLWAACADCARAIVQSGITELVRHGWFLDNSPDRWKESIAIGDRILVAGGVKITRYDEPIRTHGQSLRFCEQDILPWGKT